MLPRLLMNAFTENFDDQFDRWMSQVPPKSAPEKVLGGQWRIQSIWDGIWTSNMLN